MKKSKLKMGLVTSFICGMALTACDITASDTSVVEYTDYSGSKVGISTENMYSEEWDTSAGLTKYYEKVRDLLVRATFKSVTEDANGLKVKTPLATLEAQAANKVEEQKETARKNAKNNDTSYSDELEAIFNSHDCEDEEGLRQRFLLDLEKEQLDSAIMDNDKQLEILRDGNGSNEKGWIESAKPYHIKHMLVKIDGGADNFTRATISKDEAEKLSKVVTLLASGEKFDDLAANNMLNDDSSDKLGDVGIVNNNATSKSLKMVSEFQLGIYTADVKINGKSGAGIGLESMVDINGTGDVKVEDTIKVNEVPYEIFDALGQVAKYPEETEDQKIKDVNACVYPRNVYWNKYLNNHNVFVIVNKIADTNDVNKLVTDTVDTSVPNNYDEGKKSGFHNGYLCAEDGKVIFGVRSEYGIHFIKIQKSAYDTDLKTYYPVSLKVGDVDVTKQPVGSNYIVGLDNAKDTYDNRLSDIKSAIKGYDSNSEYRLYNYLVSYAKTHNILKTDDENTNKILAKIDDHIADLKAAEVYKQTEGLKSVWENYLRLIELQDEKRSATWTEGFYYDTVVGGNNKTEYVEYVRSALIPQNVGDEYLNMCLSTVPADKAAILTKFVEGGEYYYGK
jgi:hypothetical protein